MLGLSLQCFLYQFTRPNVLTIPREASDNYPGREVWHQSVIHIFIHIYIFHVFFKFNVVVYILFCFSHEWLPMFFNTLRPGQNGRHFPDDILKWTFLNEDVWLSIKISLKFVVGVQIKNIQALVEIMAGRRPGDQSLYEPMMFRLLTHICDTRLQCI